MTEAANRLRDLRLNHLVEFMFLGDPIKSLLVPYWCKSTPLPAVYRTSYQYGTDQINCNVWDLAGNMEITCRMFPIDGTVNTGFDYCIVVYDAITRVKKTDIQTYLSIKDQIVSKQHPNRKCKVLVLILKTPRTKEEHYNHVLSYCQKYNIHSILVDNTHDGLSKIKDLPERLCNVVYQQRKDQLLSAVENILKESSSVKNG